MAAAPQPGPAYRKLDQAEFNLICAKHDRLWSSRPGGARAVLAWADLSGLDLRGRNLCDADLTGAVLTDCLMQKVRLDNANLFGANLPGADLFEADLRQGAVATADRREGFRRLEPRVAPGQAQNAVLAGANLERSRLSGIMALKADFSDAILKDAKLVRANLKQANLSGADLSGCELAGADLRDAVLVGAKTFGWNVSDANLKGVLTDEPAGVPASAMPYQTMIQEHARWCETGGAGGKPSVFDGADLRKLASIRGFNLTALSAKGAGFYGLDMEGGQLPGAPLEGADLRNCKLRRADLRGAKLKGAKLSGADLREAQMGPLLLGGDRVLPCDMTEATLKGADLTCADLRQAILANADVSRANFTGAMLRLVNGAGVIRTGARGFGDVI